eukprot:g10488.t1 g10488   contig4:1965512-1966354(+)
MLTTDVAFLPPPSSQQQPTSAIIHLPLNPTRPQFISYPLPLYSTIHTTWFDSLLLLFPAVSTIGAASAFAPTTQFCRTITTINKSSSAGGVSIHGNGCICGSCSQASHGAACKCASCARVSHSALCACASCVESHSASCSCASCSTAHAANCACTACANVHSAFCKCPSCSGAHGANCGCVVCA